MLRYFCCILLITAAAFAETDDVTPSHPAHPDAPGVLTDYSSVLQETPENGLECNMTLIPQENEGTP